MHDIKNISIAWISSATSIAAALELKTVLAIMSAIILPALFFAIGKTADILLQIHFKRREEAARIGAGGRDADDKN